jgi:D-glycero-D-manno-heptose 1,7-bisphosphate phosphatase
MVGDAISDMLAAQAVGARPVLVRTGRGALQAPTLEDSSLEPVLVVDDLAAALAEAQGGLARPVRRLRKSSPK